MFCLQIFITIRPAGHDLCSIHYEKDNQTLVTLRTKCATKFSTCWLMAGRGDANTRTKERAEVIGQVIVTYTLTKRHASNLAKKREPVRESPLLVAAGVSVHQHMRSRNMVELLHGMGLSISNKQVLRQETSLAHVVYDTALKNGTYIPWRLDEGTPIHFAVDNIDFQEDTVDGRNILHGTITVAFQPGKTYETPLQTLAMDPMKSDCLLVSIY